MSGPREKHIVKAILERAEAVPGMVLQKRHGTVFGFAGEPDLSGCWFGLHIEIEVKRPGHDATVLQLKRLEEWRAAGALTGVMHSASEFSEFLARAAESHPQYGRRELLPEPRVGRNGPSITIDNHPLSALAAWDDRMDGKR